MAFHRRPPKFVLAIFSAGLYLSCGHEVAAQVARYQPQSPTISPYLNLTRFNNGGLPNYFALVRPQIQQRQVNLQEQARLRQNERQIVTLQNEVQQGITPAGPTGSNSWFMTPGKQATFLNTSRYYPEPVGRGRRQ